MPTYEYACTSCGQHVEVVQRVGEDPLTTCGVCGGRLRKVFHPAGILFRGSGFYATDSRKAPAKSEGDGAKKAAESSGGSDAKTSGGKESGGTESGGRDSGGKESGSGATKDKTA